MSLRLRLMASIIFVLLVSLCIGGLAAGWHAVRSVRTEMQAALAVGAQTLRNGIDDLPDAGDPGDELGRLVRTFDGDRHVRAVLRDATGGLRMASTLPALTRRRSRHGSSPYLRLRSRPSTSMGALAASSRSKLIPATRSRKCGRSFRMISSRSDCSAD